MSIESLLMDVSSGGLCDLIRKMFCFSMKFCLFATFAPVSRFYTPKKTKSKKMVIKGDAFFLPSPRSPRFEMSVTVLYLSWCTVSILGCRFLPNQSWENKSDISLPEIKKKNAFLCPTVKTWICNVDQQLYTISAIGGGNLKDWNQF